MPDLDLIKQVEQGVRDRRGWTFYPSARPVGALRLWSGVAALFAVIACALPAAAQQSVGGGTAPLALPLHPTEAGKPLIYDPQFVAKSGEDKAGDEQGLRAGVLVPAAVARRHSKQWRHRAPGDRFHLVSLAGRDEVRTMTNGLSIAVVGAGVIGVFRTSMLQDCEAGRR